jgi:hypothetical protein
MHACICSLESLDIECKALCFRHQTFVLTGTERKHASHRNNTCHHGVFRTELGNEAVLRFARAYVSKDEGGI